MGEDVHFSIVPIPQQHKSVYIRGKVEREDMGVKFVKFAEHPATHFNLAKTSCDWTITYSQGKKSSQIQQLGLWVLVMDYVVHIRP